MYGCVSGVSIAVVQFPNMNFPLQLDYGSDSTEGTGDMWKELFTRGLLCNQFFLFFRRWDRTNNFRQEYYLCPLTTIFIRNCPPLSLKNQKIKTRKCKWVDQCTHQEICLTRSRGRSAKRKVKIEGIKPLVIFLDFHSTKQGLPLVDLGHVAFTKNQMSHRYVSGVLQNDWNYAVDFRSLDRSQRRCYIWVSLSYKTVNTVVSSLYH